MLYRCLDVILFVILFYASYKDVKTRNVPDYLHIYILVLGIVKVISVIAIEKSLAGILPAVAGMLFGFGIMLWVAYSSNGRLGGADIKIMGACGLYFGVVGAVTAILIGSAVAICIMLFADRVHHCKAGFPYLPYLSMVFLLATFIINS